MSNKECLELLNKFGITPKKCLTDSDSIFYDDTIITYGQGIVTIETKDNIREFQVTKE